MERMACAAPSLWLGLCRSEADAVVARLKSIVSKEDSEKKDLRRRMLIFSRDAEALVATSSRSTKVVWKVTVEAAPRYLFGRYRKLSRGCAPSSVDSE